jgi:hypothetical protein
LVPGIPSPKDVLGYHIGAPQKLTYYGQAIDYYRALASKTPRVKVMPIGKTDEGRECVVVFLGSEESMKNLERYRTDLARLADPRSLSETEAQQIIDRAKPLYHLMGGLHSAETGPPEMLMELAYRLAVEDSPLIRQIRAKLIVSLTPAAEPDGRDRYVDWYYRHLIDSSEEKDPGQWTALLGQVRLPRQQPGHQLLAADDANPFGLVLEVASAHHARAPRVGALPLHLQRSGAAKSHPRSHPLRRVPLVRQLRDGPNGQVRNAGRLDPRLRGHVVPGLLGLHVLQPQRHAAHARDLRKRRRHHHEAQGGSGGASAGLSRSDDARVVPALAALQGSRVVDAQ